MDNPDTEARLMAVNEASFGHLPYYVLQTYGHETDGGFASLFETNTHHRFDSTFAGEVGGKILDLIVAEIGIEELEKRHMQLWPKAEEFTDTWRLPLPAAEADLKTLAERGTDFILDKIGKVFPEIEPAKFAAFRSGMVDFSTDYARYTYANRIGIMVSIDQKTLDRMGNYVGAIGAVSSEDGFLELALLGKDNELCPGKWTVVTHQGCNPDEPSDGTSGVSSYDTLDDALDEYYSTATNYQQALEAKPRRR